jgi:uncharacterized protein (TIGR00730 family)
MSLAVCVFCGSRPGDSPAYVRSARDLGAGIGAAGWKLVYGGGDVGLMGIVADSALQAGAQVIGIIPQRLLDREVGKRGVNELVVTRTMYERKQFMVERSDAFVVLPGGLGTLDELLEVITLRQLGYHDCPIIIVDIGGYWAPCIALLDRVIATGFADATARKLYSIEKTVEATLAALRR